MKVIKRDGRIVDYDKSKIAIAIEKANKEVTGDKKAKKADIKFIIEYIEGLDKKRILVEDIQDIIEQKLMEIGKYELAKKYIVYRYNRALVRKSNTTDKTILGLIRNNEEIMENQHLNSIAATKRDLIAGEVSKDLTKRVLLPEKVSNAWKDGVLYFHASNYFIQPIINNSVINMKDMLDNGTVLNGILIESPKSFGVACTIITQIILLVASNQYGEQVIDLGCLGKYLKRSKEKFKIEIEEELGKDIDIEILKKLLNKRIDKELASGVQTLECQINNLITANGKEPMVTFLLNLNKDDEYLEENSMIIQEILKQRMEGMKNEFGEVVISKSPKLIYVLNELNSLGEEKFYYLTKLAEQCSEKNIYPMMIEEKKLKQEMSKRKNFNQGVVSINLAQIGIISEGNEEMFWSLLNERLEVCKDALMCRHYALLGTFADISPIHWRYGGITRLESGEKIDKYLYNGYSSLSLGYVGIDEASRLMTGEDITENKSRDFAVKVKKYLNDFIEKWKKETDICFSLENMNNENVTYQLLKIDKEKFGTIDGITDKIHYMSSI